MKTKDGFTLEAMLIKPPDFDPSKKYPVFEHTYSGPHAPQVHNAWGGVNGLYFQLLAQRGIVVWVCDNRSASGKGAESAWVAYKRLGETELADLEECLGYLKSKPWVDSSRIGLDGWSYGGFMTSYALTHSTSWSMGISGGTVTDWNNYDSIYTERYMLMPQNNPDGYARTAPKNAAANLHGQLLLLHGAIDDNVHMANTMQFVVRAREGEQAVRADALSEVAPRRGRAAAGEADARADARVHAEDVEAGGAGEGDEGIGNRRIGNGDEGARGGVHECRVQDVATLLTLLRGVRRRRGRTETSTCRAGAARGHGRVDRHVPRGPWPHTARRAGVPDGFAPSGCRRKTTSGTWSRIWDRTFRASVSCRS